MLRRRTKLAAIACVGIVAVGGVAALVTLGPNTPEAASMPAVATATAERSDLVDHVELNGTLNYGAVSQVGTSLQGTVTSLAEAGATIKTGDELMRVNDEPVTALRGALPAWRDFEPGMSDGRDIQQLEESLASLDYFWSTPDEHFDWNTATAIASWQRDLGMPWRTTLERGRIAFLSGDARVHQRLVSMGEPAAEASLEITGTDLHVTAELDAKEQQLLRVGENVDVKLPNGKSQAGIVETVGTAVEREDSSGKKTTKIPVQLGLKDSAQAADFANVTVRVSVNRTVAEQVLSVPIKALLAQPGGSFAVDVLRDDTVQRVPVEVGKFADGRVEITAGELAEGDVVAVAE